MRTDADHAARVRDPAIELLLTHAATLTDEWCGRGNTRADDLCARYGRVTAETAG